jgi:hypothetical protein
MLGYSVDFGQQEIVNLLASPKFIDKQAVFIKKLIE